VRLVFGKDRSVLQSQLPTQTDQNRFDIRLNACVQSTDTEELRKQVKRSKEMNITLK
jgi:hypothetical protein